MNQRTFLGLTHNPFTPPREGFFSGGDRKTHLEHLRHLSQWSRRILVVTGPFGIGKSSLFRELSGSLEPNTRAARLSGTVVTSEREALVGLLQGFGIAADLDAHADDLSELIVRHVDEQEGQGRVCMVMVDDAHLMEVQAVARLVRIVATSALRLLLFAEASLITELNRAAKSFELEWFEIRLTGFPKADLRDYLEWRFGQAHYRGRLPFTDEQLDRIVARSSGNPSVVDSMANRLLADMETGEIRNQKSGFPFAHAALAVLLVVMVGLVYVFVQEDPLAPVATDAVPEPQPAAADQPAIPDTGSVWVDEQSPAEPSPTEQTFAEQANAGPASAAQNTPIDESIQAPGIPELAAANVATDLALVEDAAVEAASADQEAIDTAPADVEAAEAPAADVELPRDPVVTEPAPVTTAGLENAPAVPVTTEPTAGSAETAVAESEPAADPTPEPAADIRPGIEPAPARDESGTFKSGSWILAQDPSRYTMQLLTLSSFARASDFINRQPNPDEFAVYRIERDGRLLHVVTYGLFSGRDAAQQAADNLQGELAGINPWIRPMRLVQDAVRTTAQE